MKAKLAQLARTLGYATAALAITALTLSGPVGLVLGWKALHQAPAVSHRLAATVVEQGLRLNQLAPPNGNVSLANNKLISVANASAAGDSVPFGQFTNSVTARLITGAALPAYTYANGTSGVGATITLNANAALPAIEGVSPSVNDLVLVTTGAALSDNGLYIVTALGDGSTTPGVLTRSTMADTASKLAGLNVQIMDGNSSRAGAPVYVCVNPASSITIGTTGLIFLRASVWGAPRLSYGWATDFDLGVATVATGISVPNAGGLTAAVSGTGASCAFNSTGSGNTDTEIGIFTASTGTVATGSCELLNRGGSINYGSNAAVWWSAKVRIANLSGATDTFDTHIGTISGGYAAGVWISGDSNADTHWRIIVKSAGTTTQASTVTITANQWYRMFVWKDAGSTQIQWAIDDVRQTNPATTNTPTTTPTGPNVDIVKSAGTTSRTLDADWFAGGYYYPLGR